MNVCVVIHNPHFHNQDFTLLKSNLVFGLGCFFFLSLQQTLKLGMKERKGRLNMAKTLFLHDPCPILFLHSQATKKIPSHKNQMAL